MVQADADAGWAFALPAEMHGAGYRLRPEIDADEPFMLALFASTRAEELLQVDWNDAQKAAFCAQQFAAQRKYYHDTMQPCRFEVLEHAGDPVGRLYLQERPTMFYVVDLSLLPNARGKGVGTAIFLALHDAARLSGRSVGLMVEKFNRALQLYRRLGYRDSEDYGVYQGLIWSATPFN